MIRTDIVKQCHVGDTYYILDEVPFDLEEAVNPKATTIYVPQDYISQYKALNPTFVDKIKPYNYKDIRVTKPEFYDQVAVIMTMESNPEMMTEMFRQNLCKDSNYMTLAEAKAVTNFNLQIMRDNVMIRHFDEFKYFTGVTELPDYMFWECLNLEIVTLPPSIKKMGKGVFGIGTTKYNSGKRSKLKYVSGCDNVEQIGSNCFQYCSELISVDFSNKLKTVGENPFNHCQKLITVGDLSGIENIATGILYDCPSITSVKLNAINLGRGLLFCGCTGLTNVNIKWDEIESLPAYMLSMPYDNVSTFGKGIISIPNMPNLTTFGIRSNIGVQFQGNIGLKYIGDMPKLKIVEIGSFNMCSALRTIGSMESVTTIKQQGFGECGKLEYAYFPVCTNVGQKAFQVTDWSGEENRIIEFGLPYTSITFHNQAFYNCKHTRIICNKVELTAEQYQAVGATKPIE